MEVGKPLSFLDRITRIAIKTGRFSGLLGWPGRLIGRKRGTVMVNGCRIIIDDPMEYMQRQIVGFGVYEPEVAKVLMTVLEPGDVFFDVGANIGNHTLVAAKHGACTYSFEPIPRLAERIRKNIRFNRFGASTVVNVALGASVGVVTMHVARCADDGSHSIIPGVEAGEVQKIQVPQTTLDLFLETIAPATPTLIKIDVEGYESRVLDGALSLLRSPTPPIVVFETGDRLASQLQESANSVLGRLFDAGYNIFALTPQATLVVVARDAAAGDLQNYLAIHPRSIRAGKLSNFGMKTTD